MAQHDIESDAMHAGANDSKPSLTLSAGHETMGSSGHDMHAAHGQRVVVEAGTCLDAEDVGCQVPMETPAMAGHDHGQMTGTPAASPMAGMMEFDLAYIDMVILHHQMAIDTSEIALEQAGHQESRDIAERVIAQQQIEIDELETIRVDLEGIPAA
jgi:uncharacterized protein (DUF305 family)